MLFFSYLIIIGIFKLYGSGRCFIKENVEKREYNLTQNYKFKFSSSTAVDKSVREFSIFELISW